MPRDSLKSLMDMFPHFFDKSSTSNFYKSQDVTNKRFQELYNDLFKITQSFQLDKKLLIWKEQSVPYEYTINFVANFKDLKRVTIFKDDNVIYNENFLSDGVSTFQFDYNYDTRNELLFTHDDELDEVVDVPDELQVLLDQLLFWRIDVDNTHFDVNLRGIFNHLKSATLYKNDEVIYTNSYEDSEDETLVEYSYRNTIVNIGVDENDEENNILDDVFYVEIELWNNEETLTKYLPQIEPSYITSSNFLIEIETYDEYLLRKGWPEKDEYTYKQINGEKVRVYDDFDHDDSLDRLGKILNIPRKKYIKIDTLSEYYTSEPPFNDKLSEDDYHYMQRIIEYNLRLHDTPAPVLEIWKLYGVDAVMLNRERYLLKWFDILRHPYHKEKRTDPCTGAEYETLIVDEWNPQPWEHKDKWADGKNILGEYFYATASNIRPIKKQPIYFDFKVLNSLAQDITDDYHVIILLNDVSVETDHPTNIRWKCNPDLLDEFEDNVFTFIGKDKENNTIGTVEITIQVRGCDDADFYVSSNGDDNNDGSIDNPFQTLQKALNSVNGNLDLIAILGEITIHEPCIVKENTNIIGCETAQITNTDNPRFFHISQNKQLTIQDITFVKGRITTEIDTEIFVNENLTDDTETVMLDALDYNINIDDLQQDKFIKNLTFDQETGVLSWKEVNKSDLTKLADLNGFVTNLNLTLEDGLTFIEFSTEGYPPSILNSRYVPIGELTNAVFSITDDETVIENEGIIYVSDYGDDIFDIIDHGIDEYEIQHISSITQISLTPAGTNYNLVIKPNVLHPCDGQNINFIINGVTTNETFDSDSNYTLQIPEGTESIKIILERFISEGIVYLGCEKIMNIEWS